MTGVKRESVLSKFGRVDEKLFRDSSSTADRKTTKTTRNSTDRSRRRAIRSESKKTARVTTIFLFARRSIRTIVVCGPRRRVYRARNNDRRTASPLPTRSIFFSPAYYSFSHCRSRARQRRRRTPVRRPYGGRVYIQRIRKPPALDRFIHGTFLRVRCCGVRECRMQIYASGEGRGRGLKPSADNSSSPSGLPSRAFPVLFYFTSIRTRIPFARFSSSILLQLQSKTVHNNNTTRANV